MLALSDPPTAAAVVILLTLSLVIFVLQAVSPGDPARAYVGANASPEMVAAERQRLGLNDPFFTRYFRFLGGLFTGDLGRSLRDPPTGDLRHRHLSARHGRIGRHRFSHRAGAGGVVCVVGRAAVAGCRARQGHPAAVGHGAAVPVGARRHHRVLRSARMVTRPRCRRFRRSGTVRHAGARHPAARPGRRVRQRAGAPGAPRGGVVHRAGGGDRPSVQVVAAGPCSTSTMSAPPAPRA